MTNQPQTITTPDGTEMVLITRARFDALLAAEEELADIGAAADGRASLAGEGGIPFDVEQSIAAGVHPIVAWRKHRRISQAKLAQLAAPHMPSGALTQAAIARLESAPAGSGRPETLDAIAAALDAPRWAFDVELPNDPEERRRALMFRANPPEDRVLRKA